MELVDLFVVFFKLEVVEVIKYPNRDRLVILVERYGECEPI